MGIDPDFICGLFYICTNLWWFFCFRFVVFIRLSRKAQQLCNWWVLFRVSTKTKRHTPSKDFFPCLPDVFFFGQSCNVYCLWDKKMCIQYLIWRVHSAPSDNSFYYMAFQNTLIWLVHMRSVKTHIQTVVRIFRIWTGAPDVVYLAGNFALQAEKIFAF